MQVGYNLTIVNQREALKVSGKLTTVTETVRDMAVKSVEESATTQALTIVAALYLPASFVGVSCAKHYHDELLY